MELEPGQAVFDVDFDRWIPVPIEFPTREWQEPKEWARDITIELAKYWELSDLQRADLEHLALTVAVAPTPLAAAVARFWHLPVQPDVSRVVHAYVEAIEEDWTENLEIWATDGYEGAHFQRSEELQSDVYERLYRTSAIWPIPGADDAAAAVVLRVIGELDSRLVVIEIIDEDARVAALLFDHAVGLAESIKISPEPR